jgi:hypothetical protein
VGFLLFIDKTVEHHSFDSLTQKATARSKQFTLHPQSGVLPTQLQKLLLFVAGQTLPLPRST